MTFDTIDALQHALEQHGYVAERGLATALFLSLKLPKPLFLEGEAGVGKTEVAKTLATMLGTDADPPAVLRGAGRQHGRLRVELRPPDDADPPAGGRGAAGRRSRKRTCSARSS